FFVPVRGDGIIVPGALALGLALVGALLLLAQLLFFLGPFGAVAFGALLSVVRLEGHEFSCCNQPTYHGGAARCADFAPRAARRRAEAGRAGPSRPEDEESVALIDEESQNPG